MGSDYGWRDAMWWLRCEVEWWLWHKWKLALLRRRDRAEGIKTEGSVTTFRGVPIRIIDKLHGDDP